MELVGGEGLPVDESAVTAVVDNRGMLCTQGILQLLRVLVTVPPESVIKVLSSDPDAEQYYPALCRTTGHRFLGHRREPDPRGGSLIVSFIQKQSREPGA